MIRNALMIAGSLVSLAVAHAGTLLETTTRDLTRNTTTLATTQVQDGKIRMHGDDHDGFAIFRDDTLFVVNTRDKNYVQMDRATIQAMANTLNPALKQLQERMASLSPEQRAQIEQLLGQSVQSFRFGNDIIHRLFQYGCITFPPSADQISVTFDCR